MKMKSYTWLGGTGVGRRFGNPLTIGSVLLFFLAAACSKNENPTPAIAKGVVIKTNSTFGQILTDDVGRSLYFFSSDFAGATTCTGGCSSVWPAFYVANMTAGTGLDKEDFAEVTNRDGSKQLTYKTWPLYYYAGDRNTSDLNGDKVDRLWYVAKPDYSVMIANNNGKYLVAPKGRTLYTDNNDTNNVSVCNGNCIVTWPAYLSGNPATPVVPSLFTSADFGVITRSDGAQQTTFRGKPLYYFMNDAVRGDAKGQGLANGAFLKIAEDRF